MKKTSLALIMTAVLSLSTAAFAAADSKGFYAGANVGYSSVDIPGTWENTDGFGYNFHGGYMFDSNWGAEVGYTKYADATNSGYSWESHSVDMLAKGVYHFNYLWSGFGKIGLSSLHRDVTNGSATDGSKTKIKPAFGLGAGYTVNKNLVVNAGWSYVMGGDDTNDVGNNTLLYLGIDYHF